MKIVSCLLALGILFASCGNDDDSQEIENPETLLEEINSISKSVPCTDASEWEVIDFGYSGCGFKNQSMAFHSSINKKELQIKLDTYTETEKTRIANSEFEIACLSLARVNMLIDRFKVVECVENESKVISKTEFNNKPLIGKWKLVSSILKSEGLKDAEGKVIEFNSTGYTMENSGCTSSGTYMYTEEKGVQLMASDCIKNAILFLDFGDSLELNYNCTNAGEICFERYIKVVE